MSSINSIYTLEDQHGTYKSPMKRKEYDLNQTSNDYVPAVNLQGFFSLSLWSTFKSFTGSFPLGLRGSTIALAQGIKILDDNDQVIKGSFVRFWPKFVARFFVGIFFSEKHVESILLMEEFLHQLIGSLPQHLQAFLHPRWCRISSINCIW